MFSIPKIQNNILFYINENNIYIIHNKCYNI